MANVAKTVTVTTSNTPVQMNVAPIPVRRLYIQADPNNAGGSIVHVGGSGLSSSAAGDNAGYGLGPGDEQKIDFTDEAIGATGDLSLWWLDASTNGLKANIFAVRV